MCVLHALVLMLIRILYLQHNGEIFSPFFMIRTEAQFASAILTRLHVAAMIASVRGRPASRLLVSLKYS